MAYTGTSIVDYLKSVGQPSDYSSRAVLAQQKGIQGYVGSAEQNVRLLDVLRAPVTPAPTPAPSSELIPLPARTSLPVPTRTPELIPLPATTPLPVPTRTPELTPLPALTSIPTVESIQKGIDELRQRIATEGITTNERKTLVAPTAPPVAPPVIAPIETTIPTGKEKAPELPPARATEDVSAYFTGLQASLDASRKTLEDAYKKQIDDLKVQQAEAQKRIDEFTAKQEGVITTEVQPLLAPFRETLENAERQRLYINENFEANQKLTNELGTLLTQGNALIEQQRAVTGLAAIRDPRVAKTISDVSARVGVIEAVMSARNGQIAQAYTMIDRSVSSITADRQDRLNYYKTLLDFYGERKGVEQTKLVEITKDQKAYLQAQIGLLENDMSLTKKNAEDLKTAMTDPNLALAYAEAGITLNDSPAQIAQKLSQYAYAKEVRTASNKQGEQGYAYLAPGQTAPAGSEVVTTTDSKGVQRTWWKVGEPVKEEKIGTQVVEVGGRKLLINTQTGQTIQDLGIATEEPTQTERDRLLREQIVNKAKPVLDRATGSDGYVDPAVYLDLRQQYFEAFGNTSGFDDLFSARLNPISRERYSIGRIGVPGDVKGNEPEVDLQKAIEELNKPWWKKLFGG